MNTDESVKFHEKLRLYTSSKLIKKYKGYRLTVKIDEKKELACQKKLVRLTLKRHLLN